MKFRYYIVDSDDSSVTGTNEDAVATEASLNDSVIDTELNTLDGNTQEIPEQTTWQL